MAAAVDGVVRNVTFALRKAMWAVYAPAMDEAMKRIDDKEALKLAELLNKLGGVEHVDCGDKG